MRLVIAMMAIIGTIIIGLLVGVIAKLIMPGPDPGHGWIATLVLGLAGSFLASWFGRAIGWYQEGHAAGFLASIVGAIILLALYRLFLRMRQK